jgi:Cu(I)/Ag(I) efflux system membrane fusion protein
MQGNLIAKLAGALAVTAVLGVGGYSLYRHGLNRGMAMSGATTTPSSSAVATQSGPGGEFRAGDVDPATGKRVLYWHDPMFPGQRFDAPGRSPFMNMQLVPVYEGEADQGSVSVSPRVQQNLGVRTAEVVRRTLTPRIEAVGNIAFDERDQVIVQARATAYVERLQVRATLDYVEKGQALADLYVPEWVAAQEEFLSVQRLRGGDFAGLIDAARQRLRQAGMNDEQIRAVEEGGAVQARIALTAPIAGIVTELSVREGMTVMPGATLFRINGLSTVWAMVAVPESQAAMLRPGASAEVRSPARPGTTFSGTVQAILPEINPATRTIGARIELANPGQALTPGMFVGVALGGAAAESLTVPSEAVIVTGTRTVVIVADADGAFHPAEVEVGIEADGQTEIRSGLAAGEIVVVSGQFLVDSEASLRATSTRMEDMPAPQLTEHVGEGTITAVGPNSVTLSHGPIPSMDWDAMSMEFVLPPGERRVDLQSGQAVLFAFTMADDGKPHLTRIEPQERAQ